jgi:hypothetical protein
MSSKSVARHELQRLFPSAFFHGRPDHNNGRHSLIVMEEMHQTLKGTRNFPTLNPAYDVCKIKNGFHLCGTMKKSCEYTLMETDAYYYVMAFDKAKYVPVAKGDEHHGRDGNDTTEAETGSEAGASPKTTSKSKAKAKADVPKPNYVPEDGISFKDRRPYLRMDDPLPRDFSLALSDREDTLMNIIAGISASWIDNDSGAQIYVPPDKQVLIDGHCLHLDTARQIGVKPRILNEDDPNSAWEPKDDDEAYDTPISISYDDGGAVWRPELKNQHGEAEVTCFFLHKRICELSQKLIGMDILSIDTDVMNYALNHVEKLHTIHGDQTPPIFWRFNPRLTWVYDMERPSFKLEEWAHINLLVDLIQKGKFERNLPPKKSMTSSQKAKYLEAIKNMSASQKNEKAKRDELIERNWRKLKHPVQSLIACIITCGGDYTCGYYGMTHDTFLEAYRTYSHIIGDIVTIDEDHAHKITMNTKAYIRLVKCAYIMKKKIMIDVKLLDDLKKAKDQREVCKGKKRTGGKEVLLPPEIAHASTVAHILEKRGLDEKNLFPTMKCLLINVLQVLYFLKIIYQAGDNPKLEEPLCLKYFYKLRDSSKPLSRHNVERIRTYGQRL